MKDFRSVISDYLNKHDRHRKQLAAVISLSMLVSFTVPMILQEPASSMTGDSFTPVSDILSTQLFNNADEQMLSNYANANGNIVNDVVYSPEEMSAKALLIGSSTNGALDWANGANTVDEVIKKAENTYFLGIAYDFCVFLNGDMTVTNADAEGRVAVGGNFEFTQTGYNYQIGAGDYAKQIALKNTDNYIGIEGFAHAIIGGHMKNVHPLSSAKSQLDNDSNYEQHLFSENEDRYKRFILGDWENSTHVDVSVDDKHYNNNTHSHYDINSDEKSQMYQFNNAFNFNDIFEFLKKRSETLGKVKSIPGVFDESTNTVTFTALDGVEAGDTVYFEMPDEWIDNKYQKIIFENIPLEATTAVTVENGQKTTRTEYVPTCNLVVNCKGEKFNIGQNTGGGSPAIETYISDGTHTEKVHNDSATKFNNHKASEKILYNFYEATEESTLGANFNGTILAPKANITSNDGCSGHLSGALIAQSFEGGMEFGYRPYRGTVDILPSSSGYGVPIRKVTPSGEGLAGATFEIFEGENGDTPTGITFTSDENGEGYVNIPSSVQFDGSVNYTNVSNVLKSTYTIKETEAPSGFVKDETTSWKIDVTETVGIAESDILDMNGTKIPTHVTTSVIIYDEEGKPTDSFKIESYDTYNAEYKHTDRRLEVTRNATETGSAPEIDTFIMKMDGNGGILSVGKATSNEPKEIETQVSSKVSHISQSSYDGTDTTIGADGKPETEVKTTIITEPQNTNKKGVYYKFWTFNWSGTPNEVTEDFTRNFYITLYSVDDNGNISEATQNVNFSGNQYHVPNQQFLINGNIDKIVGISVTADNNDKFSDEKIQLGGQKIDNNNYIDFNEQFDFTDGSWSWGTTSTNKPEEAEQTTSVSVVSSWYKTIPATIYTDVIVTEYVPSTSYIYDYETEPIVSLYEKSSGYKNSTTFTTAVSTEDNQNPPDKYQFDPANKMIMPLPSDTPTFTNDYGLIFNKWEISGGDSLGLLSGAKINIEDISGETIQEDILSGTNGSVTIDLKNLNEGVTYKFVEKETPDDTKYEMADPIYFQISNSKKTITYADNESLTNPQTIDLTQNNTASQGSVNMKDTKISGAKIKLSKIENGTENKLGGAEFQLCADTGDGVLIYPLGNNNNDTFTIPADKDFDLYEVLKNAADGTYNTDYVKDGYLQQGRYYLKEITPPAGYTQQEKFKFKVNPDYSIEMVESGTPAYIEVFNGEITGEKDMPKTSYNNVTAVEVIFSAPSGFDPNNTNFDYNMCVHGETGWFTGASYYKNIFANENEKLGSYVITDVGDGKYSAKYTFTNTVSIDGSKANKCKAENGYKIYEYRIYGEQVEGSGGSSSGDSTDTGPYTVDCLEFKEAWGDNVIEEMTVYYANGDTSTLKQSVTLNKDQRNEVRITSGNGISLNHTSRDNIVGMKIKMSSNNGFKLAIQNGDWSSTLWGYDGSEWLAGDRTLEIGDISGKNREENSDSDSETETETEPEAPKDENEVLNVIVDGDLIKIPNAKSGDKTSISVEKKWAENVEKFPELKPENITVKLERYLADGTKDNAFNVSDITLPNENGEWKYTWSELESKYTDTENNENYYKYKVVEVTDNLTNYAAPTYLPDAASTGGKIEITNSLNTIGITAEKKWVDADGQAMTNSEFIPASVEVQLQYKKATDENWTPVPDGTYTLTAENGWSTEIEDLPECYEYRIVEVNVPAGWTSSEGTIADANGETTSITNTFMTGSLEIDKIWKGDTDSDRPDSIYVELYRSTQPPVSGSSAIENKKETDQYDNYAKLLQYSLYFYDANMCGSEVTENSAVTWRDDCHTYEGMVDGGFHDAGDHVMFGLPQGFTASTLGWSYYEFKDAYDSLGQTDHYKKIMQEFCDFFVKSYKDGKLLVQKGNGDTDHAYWGSPENQPKDNFGGEVWSSDKGSDIASEYAAALALYYINFKDTDPANANRYLEKAKELYKYAENVKQPYYVEQYKSDSWKDDYGWASGWLYIATGEEEYLNNLKKYQETDFTWTYCWDKVYLGSACVLAEITNDWSKVEGFINTQKDSSSNSYLCYNGYGSARYNAAIQMLALVASKYDSDVKTAYSEWCQKQMSYILGKNDGNVCLITGFANNSVTHPHHRAASVNQNNDNYVHTLVGALAGGPESTSFANYPDNVNNYTENEVALDYNAGLVGAASGLYYFYHTGTLADDKTLTELSINPTKYDQTPVGIKDYTGNTIELEKGKTGDNKDTGSLNIGDEKKFVLNGLIDGETVTWSSTDETVAEITEQGILTAVEDGEATIQAKIGDKLVAEYALTVQIASINTDINSNNGYQLVKTITISADDNSDNKWNITEANLPLYDANGRKYYYYIKETSVDKYYTISYINGVSLTENENHSGTVSVTNKKPDNGGVTMPSSGGTGTRNYYVAGVCLIGVAGILLIRRRKRVTE